MTSVGRAIIKLAAVPVLAGTIVFLYFSFQGRLSLAADIDILGWPVHLYSFFMAAGILAGYFLSRRQALRLGFSEKIFDTAILASLLFGLAAARLFFVAAHWSDNFSAHSQDIVKFWQGGLSIYGGLLGGLFALVIVRRRYKFSLWKILDALALALPVAQAIGRFGNFFNQEAFGPPTALPWRMYVDPAHRPADFANDSFFHPVFLYESLGLMVIFFILRLAANKAKSPGMIFAWYAVLAGSLRVALETLRLDALILSGLKISQVAAIVLMVSGSVILILKGHAGESG